MIFPNNESLEAGAATTRAVLLRRELRYVAAQVLRGAVERQSHKSHGKR
jgi:hypothetical protein